QACIRPDGDAGLSQCLPGKERPGVKLALGRNVTVAYHPLRRQTVSLQYVLQQRDQGVNLLRVPGIPVTAMRPVPVTGMHYLDADGAGVEPGAPLPAAVTGVPGAPFLVHQPVDGRRGIVDQVMAADL